MEAPPSSTQTLFDKLPGIAAQGAVQHPAELLSLQYRLPLIPVLTEVASRPALGIPVHLSVVLTTCAAPALDYHLMLDTAPCCLQGGQALSACMLQLVERL